MIATQHPVVSEELQINSCVVVGKQSRIQDGTLVRVLAQPRNKYEGVHFVLGLCRIQRTPNYLQDFEIIGDSVQTLQTKWNQEIHQTVAQTNEIPWSSNIPKTFRVGTEKAQFFKWKNEEGTYTKISSSDIHSYAEGFAVVMTRGPWFHVSKRNVHTAWHLVEWISVSS